MEKDGVHIIKKHELFRILEVKSAIERRIFFPVTTPDCAFLMSHLNGGTQTEHSTTDVVWWAEAAVGQRWAPLFGAL